MYFISTCLSFRWYRRWREVSQNDISREDPQRRSLTIRESFDVTSKRSPPLDGIGIETIEVTLRPLEFFPRELLAANWAW